MKNLLRNLAFAFALAVFCHTTAKADSSSVGNRFDENVKVVLDRKELDMNKFIPLAHETIQEAEKQGRFDIVGKCYRSLIIHILYNVNTDRAISELNNLRWFTERTGEGTVDLYTSWQNIVVRYYNEGDVLHAVTEFHEMLKYASQEGDDYGMSLAYTALGVVTSLAYDTAVDNLNIALEHMHKCDNRENEYYIYYIMATSAYSTKHWEKVLQHADEMMALDSKPKNAEMYANQLRMGAYIELGRRDETKAIYDKAKVLWDNDQIESYLKGEYATILCAYVCRFGNPDDIARYIDHIDVELEKAGVWVEYNVAKKNFEEAYRWQTRCDSIEKVNISELQRAEVISANVYYSTLQLKEKNQQLMIDNANSRNVLLYVVACALLVIAAGAIFILVTVNRHNRQLRFERNKALKLSDMKTTFIQNMSHEVRTPLNSIIGFNDLLNSPDFSFSQKEREEMLGHIHSQTDALVNLLNNVIFLSRMDGHDIKTHIENVSLDSVCSEAIQNVEGKLQDGVTINANISPTLSFDTDRRLLTTAITNVLDNAVKFTRRGSITIEVIDDDIFATPAKQPQTKIAITDTGDGIPIDSAELIFERFEKLGRYDAGFGLGLSIARESLHLIGGTIRLDMAYHEGARFILTLPSSQA